MANCLSPWRTLISTEVWKLAAVENTWLCRVGMVVFRSIILVAMPPHGLNGQRQGRYIHENDLRRVSGGNLSAQLASLNSSADCHALIGVQAVGRLLSCKLQSSAAYRGHPGRAAYQQHHAQLGNTDAAVA